MDLEHLTSEHLRPLEACTIFAALPDGERLDLFLIDVAESQAGPWHDRRRPFSVLYRGPLRRFLPQGTYELDHPGLGTLEIFIVPVRQDLDGYYYEAVFN